MTSARQGEVRMHIDAPPEAVWALLADIERMGEWSPECHRVEWLGGATPPATTGARFKGWNKSGLLRWSMTCEVKVADPGRELAWATVRGARDIVRWRYLLEASNGGTDVTESFEALRWPLDVRIFEDIVMRDRDRERDQAMRTTLERIKAIAEANTAPVPDR
ncbi:MAG: SRPBCC family protein [Actinobacteria bacterium]|nr:SRPBCC family protein [Actinomycetota bacterium]